jgi:hypothetical protein
MSLLVCIPTIGGAGQLTYELVQALLADPLVDQVRLYDNSATQTGDLQLDSSRVRYIHQPGCTIYDAWNEGMQLAGSADIPALVLNDDVVIPEQLVGHMVQALKVSGCTIVGVDPDMGRPAVPLETSVRRVRGSYRHGGITGHAFAISPGERWPALQIDRRFQWWGGDDSLCFAVEREGLALGRCLGLGVGHLANTTGAQHAWTGSAAAEDRVLLEELWGAGTGW